MNVYRPTVWLAADYHLPSTYSYRMPMSSMAHAPTLPTPGPATVRLALLRRSLELFGEATTREALFPILREMLVRIRPPESVAISPHLLRASKWSEERRARHPRVQESLMLREVAHAKGLLTIYLQIPASAETRLRAVLQAIGYWGQTDSFAYCLEIRQASPPEAGDRAGSVYLAVGASATIRWPQALSETIAARSSGVITWEQCLSYIPSCSRSQNKKDDEKEGPKNRGKTRASRRRGQRSHEQAI